MRITAMSTVKLGGRELGNVWVDSNVLGVILYQFGPWALYVTARLV